MRANWTKRVLFLADRVALVNQATNAFKQHLPGSAPVNLVTEKDVWDLLGWGEEDPPDEVSGEAVNKWLFNTDSVDQMLKVLMTKGHRVAGGDRLGKTIIFAKEQTTTRRSSRNASTWLTPSTPDTSRA